MTTSTVARQRDASLITPAVNWVVTDIYGVLLGASPGAAEMLNLTISGLRSRQLLMFFDGERDLWRGALKAAGAGLVVEREGTIRPREKRPMRVRVDITQAPDWAGNAVLWTFTELMRHGHSPSDMQPSEAAYL